MRIIIDHEVGLKYLKVDSFTQKTTVKDLRVGTIFKIKLTMVNLYWVRTNNGVVSFYDFSTAHGDQCMSWEVASTHGRMELVEQL